MLICIQHNSLVIGAGSIMRVFLWGPWVDVFFLLAWISCLLIFFLQKSLLLLLLLLLLLHGKLHSKFHRKLLQLAVCWSSHMSRGLWCSLCKSLGVPLSCWLHVAVCWFCHKRLWMQIWHGSKGISHMCRVFSGIKLWVLIHLTLSDNWFACWGDPSCVTVSLGLNYIIVSLVLLWVSLVFLLGGVGLDFGRGFGSGEFLVFVLMIVMICWFIFAIRYSYFLHCKCE